MLVSSKMKRFQSPFLVVLCISVTRELIMGIVFSSGEEPSTTIVIPTYNEAANIAATIRSIHDRKKRKVEVIVVDGFSTDDTRRKARRAGAAFAIKVRGGRAAQLNAGAAKARANRLLFLHADTTVPSSFDDEIARTLEQPDVVGGAFRLSIKSKLRGIRVIEHVANWRASFLQRPYGDQGLFLSASTFRQVGKFPIMPFMEDYEIVCRLSKIGRIGISRQSVITSARRWETLGVGRTTLINQFIIAAYHCGVPIDNLCNFYRGVLRRASKKRKLEPRIGTSETS